MSVELKLHNLTAYDGVKEQFETGNRSAIIHPTGTGKSFVALKLIEENPDKKVIYLSPSIPIMIQFKKNMIENGVSVRNVERMSYQKLTSLLRNSALNLQADIIILDEFHHCGAPEWGKAVRELLKQNENAKVLGLSATPVRYLDDEVRDMAEELFDNNIASEMSLEEAIATGILSEPIYTVGLYEYEQITSELEEKIENYPDTEKKKIAQAELGKLKEKLQASVSGLPELLENTMTNKSGRYIVYCKDIADMEKKMEEASKLFGRVNPNMEIMSISSRDEDIRKDETTIRNFEKETDDKKLKLLFSVNMLNEGYHLNKLDGVIMMRPTHSPTLYYQQLGRALSVGNDKQPIVIDLVNNIDTIEIIEGFSKSLGEAKERSHHEGMTRFSISEETREIRKIVEKIDELVSRRGLSNEEKLRLMTEYMNETGEKIVTGTIYKGYNLGTMRNNLRYEYNKGTLKMDDDLLKAFIREGIILEQKERVRTSVQEKYDFLIAMMDKSPEERKSARMESGLSYTDARNWLQLQYNRGNLKLTEKQIKILRSNGILNMSSQERENLEKKYESLLKHGMDLDTVLQLEKEYGSFEALMSTFKALEKKYEGLKKHGIGLKTLLAIEKEYGSFEEFMVKFKKVETSYHHHNANFGGFRGITISSREITEKEKLGYAKLVARISGRDWIGYTEATNTIAYNSGMYIDVDEFDKACELLDTKERKVLDMFYGVDSTFHTEKEISEALGFGRGVASHILNKTMRELRRISKKWLKSSKDMDEALKANQEERQTIKEKLEKIRKISECIINENGKQKVQLSAEDLENFDVIREEFENMFAVTIKEDGSIEDISRDLQRQKVLEKLGQMDVDDLGLSIRTRNILHIANIRSVSGIISAGPEGIEELKLSRGRIGKGYYEVVEKMRELGFDDTFDYIGVDNDTFNKVVCLTEEEIRGMSNLARLGLSRRTIGALNRADIRNVPEIMSLGAMGLKRLRGLGRGYEEVVEKVRELGFEIKENDKGEIEFKYVKIDHNSSNEEVDLFKKCNEVINDLTKELDRLNSKRVVLEEEQSRYKRACEVYEKNENILDPNAIVPAIERGDKIHTPNENISVVGSDKQTEASIMVKGKESADLSLDNLSLEELAEMETDLDTQIAENEKVLQEKQEQQRKELIDRIQKKRAIKKEQEAQIENLQQEKNTQIFKDTQQH